MILTQEMLRSIEENRQEALDLLLELAQIPAPAHHEQQRAEFCKNWLEKQGAKGVYIDEALNVVYPVGCTEDNALTVFMAHTDVVFPDMQPLPLQMADGKIFCPGVGDDTANLVALLMAAKYIAQKNLKPANCGMLLVANSCEEGLGNLKGCRKIMEQYGSRVTEFVTFDSYASVVHNKAVGSKRYEIAIDTEGGHSYGAFGNRNAIAYLASLINTLYTIKVPSRGKTTYNVGTISGGTSVNTIAQHAQMLYEFRSDDREDMEQMQAHLQAALELYRAKGVCVTATLVGDRPCGMATDEAVQSALCKRAVSAIETYFGYTPSLTPGSTDYNIPLSMGIPSICVSCIEGGNAHTREEYICVDSIVPGLKVAFEMILHHM